MARIRTIKPEFAHSESLGNVSREARLLFMLLITNADDAGRGRGNPRYLGRVLYPYDDDAEANIGTWLAELEAEGCIQRYRIDKAHFVAIVNWHKHQRIDHPNPSRIPPPPQSPGARAKDDQAEVRERMGSLFASASTLRTPRPGAGH